MADLFLCRLIHKTLFAMKTLTNSLLLILLLFSMNVFSQWSTDPENPGIVCGQPESQSSVRAFSDGNEGIYIFWLDSRSGVSQSVYGQHYDAAGYSQWEADGRLIVSHSTLISSFTVAGYENGDIIIGWLTKSVAASLPDTLLLQKLGTEGEKLWPVDLVAATSTEPEPYDIAHINSFGFAPVNDMYAVFIRAGYGFGFQGNRYSYFNSNGVMEGVVNGWPIGPQSDFGSSGFMATTDGSGDVILYYSTGNGMGAALGVVRAGEGGSVAWGPVYATEGSSGLNYGFTASIDEGGAIFIWQGSGSNGSVDLFARRITNSGTFGWEGGILSLCGAQGTQSNPIIRKSGSTYFIAWADARPGVSPGWYDIYTQKLDSSGAFLWAADGVETASFNTYDPYPRLAIDAEDNIIVAFQSNVSGYIAQKITPDAQLPWGEAARLISSLAYAPASTDHTVVSTGDNTIAVWTAGAGDNSNVCITRIDEVLHASLPENSNNKLSVFPNPAGDHINVILSEKNISGELILYNAAGNIVMSKTIYSVHENNTITLSTKNLPAGTYFLRLSTEAGEESKSAVVVVR